MSRATWLSNVRHGRLAVMTALAVLELVTFVHSASAHDAVKSNQAPIAAFTDTTFLIHNYCGFFATFNASGSVTPAGTSITHYAWSFGDGNSLVTTSPTTFQGYRPGSYNVTLTVTDSAGKSASTSRVISGGTGCL